MMVAASKSYTTETPVNVAGSDNECTVEFAKTKLNIICGACGRSFQPKTADLKRRVVYCCSRPCASRRAAMRGAARLHALYPQSGESNFNFRGWASRRPAVYVRRFKSANPEKVRAQRVLAAAIRRGDMVRPASCLSCDSVCRPDAHHTDYTKPLRVEWVCRRCHRRNDAERQRREVA